MPESGVVGVCLLGAIIKAEMYHSHGYQISGTCFAGCLCLISRYKKEVELFCSSSLYVDEDVGNQIPQYNVSR